MSARVRIECRFTAASKGDRLIFTRADIFSPYDPARVDVIRTVSGRQWKPDAKCWEIPGMEVFNAVRRLLAFGDSVRVTWTCGAMRDYTPGNGPESEPERPKPSGVGKTWAEQLLGACSPSLADSVYRQLSRALHPDVGGDEVLMKELNRARDALKGRR